MGKTRLKQKLARIKKIIRGYRNVIIAFSGGVDSSLLLKIARDELKDRAIAVTASAPIYSKNEFSDARRIAKILGCQHIIVRFDILHNPRFVKNTPDRCYLCKLALFRKFKKIGRRLHGAVLEGSNRTDLGDYRPGLEAIRQLDIRSPFIEAGVTKAEIRTLARRAGLPNWNKPALACLASRIPCHEKIDRPRLKRIDRAESYLGRLNLSPVRVRDHGSLARLETKKNKMARILKNRRPIIRCLKRLGYRYICLDLEGYRRGSLNPGS